MNKNNNKRKSKKKEQKGPNLLEIKVYDTVTGKSVGPGQK